MPSDCLHPPPRARPDRGRCPPSKRNVAVFLRQHPGRLVAQQLEVLAQYPPRQRGVDDVVHEPAPSGNLSHEMMTKRTRERRARVIMRERRTYGLA